MSIRSMNWFIIVSACFFLAALIFWMRSREPEMNSFFDFVKDPSRLPDLGAMHENLDHQSDAMSGNPSEIRDLVYYYTFGAGYSEDAWGEKQLIRRLGHETHEPALEILRDKERFEKLNRFDENAGPLGEAPINRLLDVFDPDKRSPSEIIEPLQAFLGSEHLRVRQKVAYTICSIGTKEIIPTLQRVHQDEEDVKKWAFMGLRFATSEDRVPEPDKALLYETIEDFWSHGDYPVSEEIPLALCYFDPVRAFEFLTSESVFNDDHGHLYDILEAFKKNDIVLNREILLQQISQIENKEEAGYRDHRILSESLELLGKHEHPDDIELIESYLEHEDEWVVESAAASLYRFHHFFDDLRDPWEVDENEGWDALTQVEKHLCAVQLLRNEVDNGGFTQYFFNSSGDTWEDARDGLEAAGMSDRLHLMNAALAYFPDGRPAADREKRSKQLSAIIKKKEATFEEIDSDWYNSKEIFHRYLLFYNLANKENRGKKEPGDSN